MGRKQIWCIALVKLILIHIHRIETTVLSAAAFTNRESKKKLEISSESKLHS